MEKQTETIRICNDCGGAFRIDSSSDRGNRVLAVHIPIGACPACKGTGQDWFANADPSLYETACLQDRSSDQFIRQALR